ncbi:MAG: endonuclease [Bacteroidia bacterium]
MTTYTKLLILTVSLIFSNLIVAQRIETSLDAIDFGTIFEDKPDSQTVWLYNRHTDTVVLGKVHGLSLFGSFPWTLTLPDSKVAPGDSMALGIRFEILHNVDHTLPIIIENNAHRGPVALALRATGRYNDSYYSSTNDLKEQALKDALNTKLAQGYTQHPYSDARDQMYMIIDNQRVNGRMSTQNLIECMYSARKAIGYNSRSEAQINDQFDTEHVWPQSLFNQDLPMRSDLHHLFPTWSQANSTRGNFPFGVVTGAPTWTVGGSKFDNSTFEPRDYAKGRTARAMMYFVIRYQNYNNYLNPQENILRTWHAMFPPDSIDRRRNADIFAFQGNKNPFVDYPQFIDRITSLSGNSVDPVRLELLLPEDSIDYADVQAGQPAVYSYVIVNQGNMPVTLQQFSLNQPELSFIAGSNDTIIHPGEFNVCKIALNGQTSGSFSGTLSFTSSATISNYSVPIFANVIGDVAVDQKLPMGMQVFPSPAREQLTIRWEAAHPKARLEVLDSMGKLLIVSEMGSFQKEAILNLQTLPTGNYILNIKAGENRWSRKFSHE